MFSHNEKGLTKIELVSNEKLFTPLSSFVMRSSVRTECKQVCAQHQCQIMQMALGADSILIRRDAHSCLVLLSFVCLCGARRLCEFESADCGSRRHVTFPNQLFPGALSPQAKHTHAKLFLSGVSL
jgi:hypothetical protein